MERILRHRSNRSGQFYVEPIMVLTVFVIFVLIAMPTFRAVQTEMKIGRTGKILSEIRTAIVYQRARIFLVCAAPGDEKFTIQQLYRNDITAAGSCQGKAVPDSDRRFIQLAHFPDNPFNQNQNIVNCANCVSPCDPKCLGYAALQYAGWCFNPDTNRFWAASDHHKECAL